MGWFDQKRAKIAEIRDIYIEFHRKINFFLEIKIDRRIDDLDIHIIFDDL